MSNTVQNTPVRPGRSKAGRKPRPFPKGRQIDHDALIDVQELLGDRPRRRDLLIEYLHLIHDAKGHLSAAHLNGLAKEMRLPQAEVFEVATFYHHFDVVKEGEDAPPEITIRVCDSLSCALEGAEQLIDTLKGAAPANVRVVHARAWGAARAHLPPRSATITWTK